MIESASDRAKERALSFLDDADATCSLVGMKRERDVFWEREKRSMGS